MAFQYNNPVKPGFSKICRRLHLTIISSENNMYSVHSSIVWKYTSQQAANSVLFTTTVKFDSNFISTRE